MAIINPAWGYKQPDDVFLLANYQQGKYNKEEIIKKIIDRDGCTIEKAEKDFKKSILHIIIDTCWIDPLFY